VKKLDMTHPSRVATLVVSSLDPAHSIAMCTSGGTGAGLTTCYYDLAKGHVKETYSSDELTFR
jgi:hypothetical protein